MYSLSHLSSGELIRRLEGLVRRQDELTAHVQAHVGEVDARKLYLGYACSSMFAYCTDVLRLSRGATYKRICAARAARKHPAIYELVAAGRLHLSAVCLLAPHLTTDNGDDLLAEATGCSKRQVEKLLVRRFPKPDVETTVRALPMPRGADASKPGGCRPEPTSGELPLLSSSQPDTRLDPACPGVDLSTAAQDATPGSSNGHRASGDAGSDAPAPVSAPAARRRRDELTPLSSRRYKLQLTAGQSLHDKLKEAQQLLGDHVAPGDLAAVFEQGLDLLIRDLRRKRFAETVRPRRPKKPGAPAQGSGSEAAGDGREQRAASRSPSPPQGPASSRTGGDAPEVSPGDRGGRTPRYIPAEVRRTVARRDGYQCAFVDPETGRRCPERSNLQYHHEHPWAWGGCRDESNISPLCGPHNRYVAEQDYGAEYIARRVEQARQAGKIRRGARDGEGAPKDAPGGTCAGALSGQSP